MHIRATKHFQYGLLDPQRKEKKNYLHGKAPNKQKKNGKYFWVFLFNYYSKEINYYYFLFFLRFIKHTRRRQEKENNLAWILQ